jgi:hypothetical protein
MQPIGQIQASRLRPSPSTKDLHAAKRIRGAPSARSSSRQQAQ